MTEGNIENPASSTRASHPATGERLEEISQAQREHYNLKCNAIAPLLRDGPRNDPTATVESQAKKYGFTKAAIYGWLAKVEKAHGDLTVLIPTPRGGKGKSRTIIDADPADWAINLCLLLQKISGNNEIPVSEMYRQFKRVASEKGWRLPSRDALRRLLHAKIPRAIRVYALEGAEGVEKKVLPKGYTKGPDGPNHVWVCDSKRMHVWCVDGNGKPFRPILIVILDRFCTCVMGWSFARHPSAFAFGRAFYIAVLANGLPGALVTDAGSEFINGYVKTIFHALRVELPGTTPGRPYTRGDQEGFFSAMDAMLIRFLLGHSGHRPTEKPVSVEPTYTVEELHSFLATWIQDTWHREAFHRGRLNGKKISREELRRAVPFVTRMPNEEDLVLRLLPSEIRQVGPQGVSLGRVQYNDPLLTPLIMERATVQVRYDPLDLSSVWVFFRNRFICRATNRMALAASLTKEDLQNRLKGDRELKKAIKMVGDGRLQKGREIYEELQQLALERAPMQIAAVGGGPSRLLPVLLPVEASARRALKAAPKGMGGTRREVDHGLRDSFDRNVTLEEWEKA